MRFHGVESHYQAALEAELQELGLLVQHEVAEQIHYKKLNGESVQLPHDIRCREDLLLPREKLILELKAKGKMCVIWRSVISVTLIGVVIPRVC